MLENHLVLGLVELNLLYCKIATFPPVRKLGEPEKAREEAALMEIEARHFYEAAAQQSTDAAVRQLLGDLAHEEQKHEATATSVSAAQAEAGMVQVVVGGVLVFLAGWWIGVG